MVPRPERDEWLMSQVTLGRAEHLETLVRRYASRLLTFIRRMVGDRHHSEELFQEVFVAVWTHRSQYDFPRPFRSWLFAIALNTCRAHHRSGHRQPHNPGCGWNPVATSSGPSDLAISTEVSEYVAAGIGLLPVMQRTVVVLRIWGGLPYSEIADIIGRSEETARSHMHHGLATLRRYLEPRMR